MQANDFSTGSVKRRIIAQAIPLTLAQLVQLLYNIVDRIYIGHLPGVGSTALTGLGVTFPVIVLIAAFTSLFGQGGTPLFSIARGQKNEKEAERIIGNVFSLLMLAAAVLFVRIFLGAVFAGNFSTIFYSAAGGGLAILVTIGLKYILTKKQLWIAGCLGAIAHSIGQMAMAVALTGTPSLLLYLPVMIVVSILTGTFTGLCAQFLVNRGNLWKITST